MENQHKLIKGYKDLSQDQINLMNKVKQKGIELGELIQSLRLSEDVDSAWILIGETQLKQGLMAITRAITKPDFF